MQATDFPAAHALSVAAHWPHRLIDWKFVFALDEGLVAEHYGEMVGTALCWRWGAHHATLGQVIVSPEFQGRRIGQRLMDGPLDTVRDRSVLLQPTPEGRGLYERLTYGSKRAARGRSAGHPISVSSMSATGR